MFDVGWPELLLVMAVALVAVGPKDLPRAMHAFGLWAGKVRRMIRGIQHDFDRLAHEAEEFEARQNKKTEKSSDDPET